LAASWFWLGRPKEALPYLEQLANTEAKIYGLSDMNTFMLCWALVGPCGEVGEWRKSEALSCELESQTEAVYSQQLGDGLDARVPRPGLRSEQQHKENGAAPTRAAFGLRGAAYPGKDSAMKGALRLALFVSLAAVAFGADKKPYHLAGIYADTCTCRIPCTCDLTGDTPDSCLGVGAVDIARGDYSGSDLSGVRIAWAMDMGKWVRIYIDAPDPAHRLAAEQFVRALCVDWGKMEAIRDAKITISGRNGGFAANVNGGATMDFVITPVIGGDGMTPLVHSNTHSQLTGTFLQGSSAKASTFRDDSRSFNIAAGRNGYFNPNMDQTGAL